MPSSFWWSLSAVALVSLGSFGCSEAIPVAVDGAYTVKFSSTAGGAKCGADGKLSTCLTKFHTEQVGGVSPIEFNLRKRDTEGGARLACSVTQVAGGFAAVGTIADGANRLDFKIPLIDPTTSAMKQVPGTVVYSSPETVSPYASPSGKCNFYKSPSGQIDAGKLWVTFSCVEVDNCSQQSSCSIDQGTVAMENCDQ